MPGVSVAVADTIAGAGRRIGVDPRALRRDRRRSSTPSIDRTVPFDPTIKDGRAAPRRAAQEQLGVTARLAPVLRLPGDLRHHVHLRRPARRTPRAGARPRRRPIPGLFVCGEMLGGLFSGNYPGGTGLAAGMVFGRRAGALA